MIENLIQNLIAVSLGIMLFFSFVVAPVVFKVFNAGNAKKFIRKIFPYYYLVNLLFLYNVKLPYSIIPGIPLQAILCKYN